MKKFKAIKVTGSISDMENAVAKWMEETKTFEIVTMNYQVRAQDTDIDSYFVFIVYKDGEAHGHGHKH